ncbi:MAG: sigma-70 family RNA polymerase sigma factor [Gemmatimonadales bacterium]
MTTADSVVMDVLVANHERFLTFLSTRMGSRADAEDLLQDAYIKGMEKGDQLEDPGSAVAWFYRLLRNALTDWYRRRGAEDRARINYAAREDLVEDPRDPALFDAVCACALELAGTLKPVYADVIRAVDLGDQPVKDYAAHAGISATNAGVRLHRARQALRERVIATCGTCGDHRCVDCSCRRP